MPLNANNASENPEEPCSKVGKSSHVAYTIAISDTWTTDIGMDRGVPGWPAAEQKTRYADSLET